MKKRLLKIVIGAGVILGVAGVSGATLIAQNGIVADDRGTVSESDDSYWIQDLYSFSGQTYEEQITSINVLNEPGEIPDGPWEDWHMAEYSEMASLIETYNTEEIVKAFGTTEYYIQGSKFADVLGGRYNEEVSNDHNQWHYIAILRMYVEPYNGELISPIELSSEMAGDAGQHDNLGVWITASPLGEVPEPSSILILGTGLAGLIGYKTKKKNT